MAGSSYDSTIMFEEAPTRDPNTKGQFQIEVYGDICVRFDRSGAKLIGSGDTLICYDGVVDYGSNILVNAVVLVFNSDDGDSAVDLCENLSSVSSSYVMNVLACGEGACDRGAWSYLAFPPFHQTFASFIEEKSHLTAENGRFTEVFTELVGNIVKGFISLHGHGFFCPQFDGSHVAVIQEDGNLSGKIWKFCLAGYEADKTGNWVQLAEKIEEAAINHRIYSLEIKDLCEKMKNGQLVGLKILKHSALLSSSVKLEKVLALNQYVETFCSGGRQHSYINDAEKSQVHSDLLKFLSDSSSWYSRFTPQWVLNVNIARKVSKPSIENGEMFIFELRSMHEHGNFYSHPPENPIQDPIKDSELEDHSKSDLLEKAICDSWEADFLKILNFATALELEYE